MKITILVAVLLVVILQEASGAMCPKKCTKYRQSRCKYEYYYSYYYGWRSYKYCPRTPYTGICNETCTHGGWSDWSAYELYEECPVMCGGGKAQAYRTRTCTNPSPWNGGRECEGEDSRNETIACNTMECGDKCPDNTVKLHAHPELRHYYYQCDSGHKKAFLMNCSDGTVFNAEHNTCDHDTADCKEGEISRHPDDCGKYLRCVHGINVETECLNGLHFNERAKVCDWPALALCEDPK